jgi:hypothetical protein
VHPPLAPRFWLFVAAPLLLYWSKYVGFRDDWAKDRDAKRMARDVAQFQRKMSTPVARGEVYQLGELQMQHLASLALALEALEDILVGAGVLEHEQLMDCMKLLAARKAEQVAAAQATSGQSLIASV